MTSSDEPRGVPPLPFLKWAGSKRAVLPMLWSHLQPGEAVRTYVEPFLGGGSVALAVLDRLAPERAVLADRNPALIEAYIAVRDDVEALIAALEAHRAAHDKEHYYAVRAEVPEGATARAARLIYLNKTCFNGLYRLNRRGQFNVPMGRIRKPLIVDPDAMRRASALLGRAELRNGGFDAVLGAEVPGPGVLTYLDPPYDPVSSTASFTAYDGIPFDRDDQRRLSGVAVGWAACGAHVVASNSDTAFVRSLYPGFDRHEVRVLRKINRRLDKRGRVGELVLVKRPA